MNSNLRGKVAIVTGASSGIGAETARLLAEQGASVMLTGRREASLKAVQASILEKGGACTYLTGDMADMEFCERLAEDTVEILGRIDILVCNAGMALRTPTIHMTAGEWNEVLNVNLTAPVFLSQACIRRFLEQGEGGKIVFVSSTAGKSVNMGASPSYGASKAGLLYLTRHLAREFASDKIYVNAVCPGPVATEITKTWTPEHRAKVLSDLPLGRIGTAQDIAQAILFLASPMSDYITGESLLINGGRYME